LAKTVYVYDGLDFRKRVIVRKQSTMRYRILHACLRAMRCWFIEELIEKMTGHDLIAEKRSVERDYEAQRIRSAYTGSYAGQGAVEEAGPCFSSARAPYIKTQHYESLFFYYEKVSPQLNEPLYPTKRGTYSSVRGAPHR
jgi:hypothetical protein